MNSRDLKTKPNIFPLNVVFSLFYFSERNSVIKAKATHLSVLYSNSWPFYRLHSRLLSTFFTSSLHHTVSITSALDLGLSVSCLDYHQSLLTSLPLLVLLLPRMSFALPSRLFFWNSNMITSIHLIKTLFFFLTLHGRQLANYHLQVKPFPLPGFVNTILQEGSHSQPFTYCQWLLSCSNSWFE